MHEIEKLEKRWLKYKIKKFTTKIFFLVVILVIFYFVLSKYSELEYKKSYETKNETEKEIFKIVKSDKIENKKIVEKNATKKETIVKKEENKTKKYVTLTPKIDFLSNIEPIAEEKKEIKKEKKITKKIEKPIKKEEKPKIIIEAKQNDDVLETLIRKFEKNPDPKLAIFLSKTFYKEKEYEKALFWAIKANDLDSSNSESWILFAKASVKLGKKEEAIKALKTYLLNYNSFKIEKLLAQIINGDFK